MLINAIQPHTTSPVPIAIKIFIGVTIITPSPRNINTPCRRINENQNFEVAEVAGPYFAPNIFFQFLLFRTPSPGPVSVHGEWRPSFLLSISNKERIWASFPECSQVISPAKMLGLKKLAAMPLCACNASMTTP